MLVVCHLHIRANRLVPGLGQMLCIIQDWQISSGNRDYHMYKSVPFTEKRLLRPGTGTNMALKKRNHESPLGTFRPEKQDYLFSVLSDVPLLPEIFRWNDPKRCVPFSFQPNFWKLFVNGKQPELYSV